MRKSECIQKWLGKNLSSRDDFIKLVYTRKGQLALAHSVLYPFARRLQLLRENYNSGKWKLGWKTCIENTINGRESLISDMEDFIAIFYKKDYKIKIIKQLLLLLEDAKQFSPTKADQ